MRISDWSSDVCSSDLLDVFDEGFFLAPAWAYDTSLVGAQRHQGAYRRARLPLCSAFKPLAEQDECDDDGGWLEIIVAVGPVAGLEQQLIETEAVSGGCANGDEQVHVSGARLQRLPAGPIEAAAEPELNGGCEEEVDPYPERGIHHVRRRAATA